jgi:hypothetical protein
MRVLVACEFSGIVSAAFRAKGHDAYSCDLEPTEGDPRYHIQGDVLLNLDHGWDLLIGHPPCTYLTVTGNKWFYHPEDSQLPVHERRPHPRFPDRVKDREVGMVFFMSLATANIPKIAIENPVGIMSTLWRKPDQIIQPYQFGHPEPKKTCLWLKNLPKLMLTKIVAPEYTISKSGKRMATWYFGPSQSLERQKIRNRTFSGIAEAMATQWG